MCQAARDAATQAQDSLATALKQQQERLGENGEEPPMTPWPALTPGERLKESPCRDGKSHQGAGQEPEGDEEGSKTPVWPGYFSAGEGNKDDEMADSNSTAIDDAMNTTVTLPWVSSAETAELRVDQPDLRSAVCPAISGAAAAAGTQSGTAATINTGAAVPPPVSPMAAVLAVAQRHQRMACALALPHDITPPPSPPAEPGLLSLAEQQAQAQQLLAARTALIVANGYLDLAERQLERQQEVVKEANVATADARAALEASKAAMAEEKAAREGAEEHVERLQCDLETATTDLHAALEELSCAQAELNEASDTTEQALARESTLHDAANEATKWKVAMVAEWREATEALADAEACKQSLVAECDALRRATPGLGDHSVKKSRRPPPSPGGINSRHNDLNTPRVTPRKKKGPNTGPRPFGAGYCSNQVSRIATS